MDYIIFKTSNDNHYLYSPFREQFIFLHPITSYLLEQKKRKVELKEWIRKQSNTILIPYYGEVSKNLLLHYFEKIVLFEECGFLNKVVLKQVLNGKLTPSIIESSFINTQSIVFEVTDDCNLNCKYCAYNKLYKGYDKRNRKYLDFHTTKRFLDYHNRLANSNKNSSYKNSIRIGFYGGEPLMHIELIKKIVNYTKTITNNKISYNYGITTNGILLEKNMDFLVENNFSIVISLDGNKENNGYRSFKNNKSSFDVVFNNILKLKNRYPDYYKRHVLFNTVLHNKNSVEDVFNFFSKHLEKKPQISELSTLNISKKYKKEFWRTYKSYNDSFKESKNCSIIEDEMLMKLPEGDSLENLILSMGGFHFIHYLDLLKRNKKKCIIPTGTCLPFSKKIFISVNKKIYPCESIGHKYPLGKITSNQIQIDFEYVADFYNNIFSRIKEQCFSCYRYKNCDLCFFFIDSDNLINKGECNDFMNYEDFKKYLSKRFTYFESKPQIYSKIDSYISNQ